MGRPQPITLRLGPTHDAAIRARATNGRTISDVLRDAVSGYLASPTRGVVLTNKTAVAALRTLPDSVGTQDRRTLLEALGADRDAAADIAHRSTLLADDLISALLLELQRDPELVDQALANRGGYGPPAPRDRDRHHMPANRQRLATVRTVFRQNDVPADRRWALAQRAVARFEEVTGQKLATGDWEAAFPDDFPALIEHHETELADQARCEQLHAERVEDTLRFSSVMAFDTYRDKTEATADLTRALIAARLHVDADTPRVAAEAVELAMAGRRPLRSRVPRPNDPILDAFAAKQNQRALELAAARRQRELLAIDDDRKNDT